MTKTRNRVVAIIVASLMAILTVFVPNMTASASNYVNSSVQYNVYSGSGQFLGSYLLNKAETISSTTQTTSIIGTDDREEDYSKPGVVQVTTDLGNGYIGLGTGFVVSDHVIATAAYVVYDRDDDGALKISSINFVDKSGETIQKISDVNEYHIPTNYVYANDDDAINYDYALIYVDEDLSDYTCFNLGFMLEGYNGEVSVTGFQGSDNADTGAKLSGKPATATGNVVSMTDYRCTYNADTTPGVSGAPVYVTTKSYNGAISYSVIAIHTHSGNSGVRITTNILQFYNDNAYIGAF